jgi:hypothetical protein
MRDLGNNWGGDRGRAQEDRGVRAGKPSRLCMVVVNFEVLGVEKGLGQPARKVSGQRAGRTLPKEQAVAAITSIWMCYSSPC